MYNKNYKIVIVGSGATGGVAAFTFATAGVKVLVIEAGPKLSSKEAFGSEPLNTFRRVKSLLSGDHRLQAQHPGFWKTNPLLYINEKDNAYKFPPDKPFLWTQGRQLGGRSLTWGGITLRLSKNDFKAAKFDGYGPEWPISYGELAPHYSYIEKLLKVFGNKDGLDQLPDGEYLKNTYLNESEMIFKKNVTHILNYPLISSRGFEQYSRNKHGLWPPSSSIGSSLDKAIKTGNVEILTNHLVEKIVLNHTQDKAKSLVVLDTQKGERSIIESDYIVLCSSTIQTLKILLNSSEPIQSKGLIDPSGSLGCSLMDHISLSRFFSFPDKTTSKTKQNFLSGADSFFIPFGSKLPLKEEIDFIRGYGIWGAIDRFEPPYWLKRKPKEKIGFLIAHGEVLPYKENRVTLTKNTDKWGIPIPMIEFKWRKNEINMVKHMEKTIQLSIKAGGGEQLALKDLIKMPFIEPLINKAVAIGEDAPPPGYYIHEVGGAPMGTKEENSVTTPFNKLWRCRNVLVVDGACWPTSAWQSPTLTMMAITRRACLSVISNQTD